MQTDDCTVLSRRKLLAFGGASLALWSLRPQLALAGTRDPRLLTMVLRGGLDGLALAAPAGDPDFARLRGGLALARVGAAAGLPLDGFFVLNPAMPTLHGLYRSGQALIVHAVASPYRGRSHFDGQDVLENGYADPSHRTTGWLNRALARLPSRDRANPQGLAMGAVVPLVMRGPAPSLSWIPKAYNRPLRDSTVARLADLYTHTDPALAKALADGGDIDRLATADGEAAMGRASDATPAGLMMRNFITTAETAARFLASADGPRIGALSYEGWDTHANEGVVTGQLANRLGGLDAAIKSLREGLGAAWSETVIVIVTEFGRTAHQNGTGGTDHGTATVALLLGGAVKGGRILCDWPGLSEKALFEGRDLAPTRDLRAVLKGVLRDHLGIPAGALADAIFPGTPGVSPADGLIG